jgi:threonine/homoserine/homoserine lactone efflux protein
VTTFQALLAFALAAGLLTVTPGIDTALVLRTAAVEGARRAMLAGAGVCAGCLAWGAVVALGLGALLAASELAYDALRLVGAGYLVVLGLRMATSRAGLADLPAPSSADGGGWLARGFLTNALNPKVGVFYVTFLPQFVPAGTAPAGFVLLLAAVHAALGLLWFAALVLATRPLGRFLRRPGPTRLLNRVTGIALVGFGVALAVEGGRRSAPG